MTLNGNKVQLEPWTKWVLTVVAGCVIAGTTAGVGAYASTRSELATHTAKDSEHDRRLDSMERRHEELMRSIHAIEKAVQSIDQRSRP